jgi:hypothetical protein
MINRVSFPGGKASEQEVDHSLLFIAEVKNAWSFTSILPVFDV